MNFNAFFLRSFRALLLPFALIYAVIVFLRNLLYDKGILKSTSFNIPVVSIGNIAVGGTGKSPMVEYLVSLLKHSYRVATLSRGYKRRTKGYILANESTTALEIGDEPMQFHIKHPDISVAVGEQRIEAIPQLLFDRPDTEVILLDDAFQHRAILPGLEILLTDCNNLYCDDFFLPTGDLRDSPSSAHRADIIMVTKCPPTLSQKEKEEITRALDLNSDQYLFFTSISYGQPYHIISRQPGGFNKDTEVLLVCGIANPEPLTRHLHEETSTYDACFFADHHIFTIDDLREIELRFSRIEHPDKIIITTEKDAVRLLKFNKELTRMPVYVLPITVHFLYEDRSRFNSIITNFIADFKTRK
jgi:tetraacyldisaccharide 4'-kinase